MKTSYKIGIFFLTAIVITLILISSFQKKFDAEAWKNEPELRYEMIADMIESQEFLNISKVEIHKILGSPNQKRNTDKEIWVYNVGHAPSFFDTKDEFLIIIFKNSLVEKLTLALK